MGRWSWIKQKFRKATFVYLRKRKENITCALFWRITFMTVDNSTVFDQKPYTALWLVGKFWLWKNRFSPVYDVTSNIWLFVNGVLNKCQYNMENISNAHAYWTKISWSNNLFDKLKNLNSKNIAILVQITRKSCVLLNDSNFNCHSNSKRWRTSFLHLCSFIRYVY